LFCPKGKTIRNEKRGSGILPDLFDFSNHFLYLPPHLFSTVFMQCRYTAWTARCACTAALACININNRHALVRLALVIEYCFELDCIVRAEVNASAAAGAAHIVYYRPDVAAEDIRAEELDELVSRPARVCQSMAHETRALGGANERYTAPVLQIDMVVVLYIERVTVRREEQFV
jgi:hypothetical protein